MKNELWYTIGEGGKRRNFCNHYELFISTWLNMKNTFLGELKFRQILTLAKKPTSFGYILLDFLSKRLLGWRWKEMVPPIIFLTGIKVFLRFFFCFVWHLFTLSINGQHPQLRSFIFMGLEWEKAKEWWNNRQTNQHPYRWDILWPSKISQAIQNEILVKVVWMEQIWWH